jgi:hypothetical protein
MSPYLQCLECGKECTHPNSYNGKCPECGHLITPREHAHGDRVAPYGTKMGVPCAKPAKKRRTKRELYDYHRDLYLKCEDPEKAKTHLARMLKHVPSGGDNWWWEDDQKARQIAENALRCTPAPGGSRLRGLYHKDPVCMSIYSGCLALGAVDGAINLAEWSVTAFVSLIIALLFVSSVVVPLVRAGKRRKR